MFAALEELHVRIAEGLHRNDARMRLIGEVYTAIRYGHVAARHRDGELAP